jgi:hypothetical protein
MINSEKNQKNYRKGVILMLMDYESFYSELQAKEKTMKDSIARQKTS